MLIYGLGPSDTLMEHAPRLWQFTQFLFCNVEEYLHLPNVKRCNSENMPKTVKLDLSVWEHNNDLHIEHNLCI